MKQPYPLEMSSRAPFVRAARLQRDGRGDPEANARCLRLWIASSRDCVLRTTQALLAMTLSMCAMGRAHRGVGNKTPEPALNSPGLDAVQQIRYITVQYIC
jgi:hypothetical protein